MRPSSTFASVIGLAGLSACVGNVPNSGFTRTTHCVIVFVAVDDRGEPTPVTPWEPATDDEIAQSQYALQLMEIRSRIETQLNPGKTP